MKEKIKTILKTVFYILIVLFILGSFLNFANRNSQEKKDDCQEYDLLSGSRCLP